MSRRHPTIPATLVALVFLASCDCENRIRKAISDPGDRKMTEDASAPSGPTEREPNDDPPRATTFEIGNELRPIHGELAGPEDVDWLAFTVEDAEQSFEVSVTPETALDISLHVDVKGSAPLSYDVGRRGDAERIPVLKVGTAPQRFAIRSEAESSGSYTVELKRHMGAAGLEAEPNDDASVATSFEVPGELQGFYDRPDDRDVYELAGDPGKAFVLEIGPAAGVRQIARIFDDPGLETPLLTVQVTAEGPLRIPNVGLPTSGSRYVVLTPLGQPAADKPYRLRMVPHPKLEVGMELEPNDATPMPLDFDEGDTGSAAVVVGYLHAADDVDRYELTPPKRAPTDAHDERPAVRRRRAPSQTNGELAPPDPLQKYRDKDRPRVPISAKLIWTDKMSALGLRWTSADGEEVEFRQTSPDLEVIACGLELDAGPATMEVRSERLSGAPTIGEPQYRLEIRESSSEQNWEAEPNNEFGRADVLDDRRRGTLAVHDDVDTFVFAVAGEPGTTTNVSLKGGARRVDSVLRLLDDGGGVVANVDNAAVGSAESIQVDLPPGIYFAELRWKGGDLCQPYEIEINSR